MGDKNVMKLKQPIVSVIIPAYNVAKYIEINLESICNQTIKDIEIIAINDGSTDTTLQILEMMKHKDSRIQIINQKNAGVSVARNSGIEAANGRFIVFVDGDDYVAADHLEYLISLVEEGQYQFGVSTKSFVFKHEVQSADLSITPHTSTQATALLLSPKVIVGCWNKIYDRKMLIEKGIRFNPELFYGEGLSFITTVSQHVEHVAVGNRKTYFYRRDNGDSATTKFDITKLTNGEISLNKIRDNFIRYDREVISMFNLHMCMYSLGAIVKINEAKMKRQHRNEYRHWKKHLMKNTPKLIRNPYVSNYRKLMLIGGCISPWVVTQLNIRRRKRIVENSVL